MEHSPVAQDRQIEPMTVKRNERRKPRANSVEKGRDDGLLIPVATMGRADRSNPPPGFGLLRNNGANAGDLVKRKLWKRLTDREIALATLTSSSLSTSGHEWRLNHYSVAGGTTLTRHVCAAGTMQKRRHAPV